MVVNLKICTAPSNSFHVELSLAVQFLWRCYFHSLVNSRKQKSFSMYAKREWSVKFWRRASITSATIKGIFRCSLLSQRKVIAEIIPKSLVDKDQAGFFLFRSSCINRINTFRIILWSFDPCFTYFSSISRRLSGVEILWRWFWRIRKKSFNFQRDSLWTKDLGSVKYKAELHNPIGSTFAGSIMRRVNERYDEKELALFCRLMPDISAGILSHLANLLTVRLCWWFKKW